MRPKVCRGKSSRGDLRLARVQAARCDDGAASTRGVRYELSVVASRAFWFAQAGQADESTVATIITEEKS